MARILLLVVLIVMVRAHSHDPKFPKDAEDNDTPVIRLQKVACSSERQRNEIIEQTRCGDPKEIFIHLKSHAAHEHVSPGSVWVKRCIGFCGGNVGTECVDIKKRTKYIPIRIYNVKTDKEICSSYPVEEHLSCGCYVRAPLVCPSPRVYDPRKSVCRCPNRLEKRMCRNKPNQIMRWNPSKCACEVRSRTR